MVVIHRTGAVLWPVVFVGQDARPAETASQCDAFRADQSQPCGALSCDRYKEGKKPPNSVTCLNVGHLIIFKECVVRCGPKSGSQHKDMCFKEIGLRAQDLLTGLCLIVAGSTGAFKKTENLHCENE